MENDIEEIVGIMEEFGYNPIHIIGRLYLVRYNSTRFSWVPFYVPRIIKKPIDNKRRYGNILMLKEAIQN